MEQQGVINGKHGKLVFTISVTGAIEDRLGYCLGYWLDHQTDGGLSRLTEFFNPRLKSLAPYCPTIERVRGRRGWEFVENNSKVEISAEMWLGLELHPTEMSNFFRIILNALKAHAVLHINEGCDPELVRSGVLKAIDLGNQMVADTARKSELRPFVPGYVFTQPNPLYDFGFDDTRFPAEE